jgi:hypothetical protein
MTPSELSAKLNAAFRVCQTDFLLTNRKPLPTGSALGIVDSFWQISHQKLHTLRLGSINLNADFFCSQNGMDGR